MSDPQPAFPVLTVIVPARNSRPWIGELVESAVSQRGVDLELIVLDNGSIDGTAEFVEALASDDERIRLIRSSASSAAAARNKGLLAARGEYVVFADSDDLVPDGAYNSMLTSLRASGSDMVIGNHLKFSATATWSPTKRWYGFDAARTAVAPRELPALMSGRACWNRMFRRSFLERAEIRFPEIASVEDIEPMTKAFIAARSIDVVPDCVYLYRDRGDSSSLSRRSDVDVTLRYFEQEHRCARLVRHDEVLARQHAEIVFDADGWAHLSRFLVSDDGTRAPDRILRAAKDLAEEMPLDVLETAAPERRALWMLVLSGAASTAGDFARGMASASSRERLAAWFDAISAIRTVDEGVAARLTIDGLVPHLVNTASEVDEEFIEGLLPEVRDLDLPAGSSELLRAMAGAMSAERVDLIMHVSSLAHSLPFVVSRADGSPIGLSIEGDFNGQPKDLPVRLELSQPGGGQVRLRSVRTGAHLEAELHAADLEGGRYSVDLVLDGVSERFPTVTARMPLPPLGDEHPIQPLADRTDGWRFLIDRRGPRPSGLKQKLTRALRMGR
ncbi:glycosyltransferase family 2 protein [Curtobacterium sp. MCSS17_016]|uniref:glycosyltransferase family 2 protein n=1 Tax=Curtobacterium sp. MCSS17_016 TaxID=2175644 RepID=UPI0015E8AF6F|nr:glycosyltransferase family 2 protein [Curtobacterium sp. MCSS17_016]WIE80443.1 glycosyltransferase family 2 protein [Curtobacterium sp. MCSS17_016]